MASRLPPLPHQVSLHRLFPRASFVGCGDIVATDATEDSRLGAPRSVFAAIPGTRCDGTHFIADALQRGCHAILTEKPLASVSVPQCIVPDVRVAYAKLCDAVVGYPARQLRIAGVTGTNGKTTTAWLIRAILQSVGRRCGLLGTVEYSDGVDSEEASLTTPDSRRFAHWFRRMVDHNCSHAAIEVSSHALHQGRIAGTRMSVAVLTNITQDHFDYHGTFENYVAAKLRMIDYVIPEGVVILNADDPSHAKFLTKAQGNGLRCITYGLNLTADACISLLDESLDGTRFELSLNGKSLEIQLPLPARHNVSNAVAAALAAMHYGVTPEQIQRALNAAPSVPGRLERVDCGQPFHVFVDYAHTDDAIRRVLECLKSRTTGRVICVFGAGGDRDRTKRPKMALAASAADLVVVTSDNPRTEQPLSIIEEIVAGIPRGTQFHVDADRRRAIEWALREARPSDCVLIAGKGHETYQIIGAEKLPFDDRQAVRDVLQKSADPRPITT